ncbi:TonB-dependent receptor [Paludibaculum fermentans]|uniref:TonB-dependent receptor n=1 Tax=Paludibaculum fermentans TaxID=1473598 RepID=UPI003EBDF3E0
MRNLLLVLRMLPVGIALLWPAASFAQIDTGSIVGTVRDSSGATVVNATVTVTNKATNVVQTTQVNASGEYQFIGLQPGLYTLKGSAAGFATQVVDNLELHVQSRPSIDLTMRVGQIDQIVEVRGGSVMLQTESADVGGVVAQHQIQSLPLNGRRYADLALLEAGVQKNLVNQNNMAPDRFSSNGNLETQNYFSLDGVDNNSGSTNLQEGSVQVVQPPPDALQEFRVQTRTYSAEFGTSAGAVINASIKSGTNQIHGSVWEFLRNNEIQANSFFNNLNGVPKGHYTQNQFGGAIGGPVIKDKTFFFFDAQAFTSRKATTVNSVVPTPLMKQGNFTELKANLTDSVVPGQTGCISGKVISASCLDPTGVKLLSLFPDPNIPSALAGQGQAGSWTGGANYQYQYSVPTDTTSFDTRIDHTINNSNRIFGRYSNYVVDRQDAPWTSNPLVGNGNFATQYRIRGRSLALSWTDTLSSSMLNEMRAGFNRDYAHSDPIGVELGKSFASDYGLTGIPVTPNSSGLPPINISGLTRMGTSPWRPQFQVAQVWQFLDNFSWLKGSHSLKFGYEHRHTSNNFLDLQSPQGQMTASGIYTGNTGLGAADFLLGNMSTAQLTTPSVVHNYMYANSLFAQDSWRVRPKLTLTLGLRYELFSPILNHQDAMANFTPANGGGLLSAASGDWFARSTIHPDKNDFAPRFGFSYQPMDRVVLRGGYGVFYQHTVRIGSESVVALNPPFIIDGNVTQSNGSTTPVFFLKNGFPSGSFAGATADLTRTQIRAQDPNQRSGYVSQVSFGPQIQLTDDTNLDISYVGNFGRKMNRLRNANQGLVTGYTNGAPVTLFPYANLNSNLNTLGGNHAFLEYATNDGNTNYNGLLVSLRRRFSKGLSYGVSYTWSHNFADFVDNLTGGSTPANAYNYSLERSNSPFDVRHKFVANAVWNIPVGKGGVLLNNDGLASRLLGGWQLNTIVTLQTGLPFTVTAVDNSATGSAHQSRANIVGDPYAGRTTDHSLYAGTRAPGFFLNPAAFATPALGTFGNVAPRGFAGPGMQDVDLSIFKVFAIREAWRLEFRAESFNAFNHPVFGNPSASITSASIGSFGKVTSTVTDPREFQFALKLYF